MRSRSSRIDNPRASHIAQLHSNVRNQLRHWLKVLRQPLDPTRAKRQCHFSGAWTKDMKEYPGIMKSRKGTKLIYNVIENRYLNNNC